jgi:hypothetical protein
MVGLPAVYDFLVRHSGMDATSGRLWYMNGEWNGNYTAPGLKIFAVYFFEVFPFITPTVYSTAMIVQTGSVYLTMAVTLERFVAVCLPFRSRSLCTYGRSRYGVIFVALFSIIYNLPRFWEVQWITYDPRINSTDIAITEVVPTALRRHPTYISVYYTWAYLIFMFVIPFSCLAIFNLLIYRQVRIANLERSRMSRQEQKEIGLATMLMVVVIVFFICNVLALVVNILEANTLQIKNTITTTINMVANPISFCSCLDILERSKLAILT